VPAQEEYVAQAVRGDRDALAGLLERYGPQVRGGLKISPKWQGCVDADDVMQVTYLEAFLHVRDFRPGGPGSFPAWLRRIAENNLRDAIRALERDKRPSPQNRAQLPPAEESYVALVEQVAGTSTTPSRVAAAGEVKELVEAALRQLPADYEKVLRLYELEGRSGPETAALMGRSHGAVKMLLARARDRLRELLGSGSKFFSHSA